MILRFLNPLTSRSLPVSLLTLLLCFLFVLSPAFGQEEAIVVEDPGWPREIETNGNKITIFQPQIEAWENYALLRGNIAISVTRAGSEEPLYGVIQLKAPTTVSVDDRTVVLGKRTSSSIEFPGQDAQTSLELKALVRSVATPDKPIIVSLDRILASLERTKNQEKEIEVNLDPPPIFYSTGPAILVQFLGEPRMEMIPEANLLFAVNTNWEVFLHIGSSRYYLLNGDHWLTTEDPKGEWKPAASLPEDFQKLPDSEEWAEARKYLSAGPAESAPKVFYSDRPAELIVTDGKANLGIIGGTKLLHVTNSESNVFLNSADGQFYFLAAGRWFRSKSLEGPWESATKILPTDFAAIPDDHPTAEVLASVPGTAEADEAILMASIPKKATVNIAEAALEVTYDGDPEFIPIPGADQVAFAKNSPFQVFQVGSGYFCCHEAVWFTAENPKGPWAVCTSVPEEIYDIPPSSPHHNVSYVYVYDTTPETVTMGYTSGYEGSYIVGQTLLFGLGVWAVAEILDDDWRWWPYHYHHAHWFSYGCAVRYNHYTGAWGRGWSRHYGPYGGAGRYATYNPATGTYRRGAVRYGPGGAAFAREAYNPSTGTWGGQVGYRSPYQSWGKSVVTRDDDWVRTGHYREGNRVVAGIETSKGTGAVGSRTAFGRSVAGKTEDNVFVGRNGNLYRRDEDGESWEKLEKGGFQPVEDLKVDRSEAGSRLSNVDRTQPKESVAERAKSIDRSKITTPTRPVERKISKPTTPYRGSSSTNYGSGVGSQLNRDAYARERGNYRSTQSKARSGSGFSGRSTSRSGGGIRSGGGGIRRR